MNNQLEPNIIGHWTSTVLRDRKTRNPSGIQQGAFRICHVTCPGPSTLTWKDLIPILNMLPEAQLMPCLGTASDVDPFHPGFHVSAFGIKKEGHTPQKNWGLEVVNTKQSRIATENGHFFWMQSGEQTCSMCQCHIELVLSTAFGMLNA